MIDFYYYFDGFINIYKRYIVLLYVNVGCFNFLLIIVIFIFCMKFIIKKFYVIV